jgi:hypothetical protein
LKNYTKRFLKEQDKNKINYTDAMWFYDMRIAFLKFTASEKFYDKDTGLRNKIPMKWDEFKESLIAQAPKEIDLAYPDYVMEKVKFLFNNTDFFDDHKDGEKKHIFYTHNLPAVAGNDGDLQYIHICPVCETFVMVDHSDQASTDPLFCPVCNEGNFRAEYVFPWDFVKKGAEGYDAWVNTVDAENHWNDKYFFKIGDPDKIFRIGKWVPCIKTKNDFYAGGIKHTYIKCGIYPYQIWLGIKHFPWKIKYEFGKKFNTKSYRESQERMKGF